MLHTMKRTADDEDTLHLRCGICLELMVGAVQTTCCGSGFCRTCLDAVLSPRRCPSCRTPLEAASVVADPRAERLSAAKPRSCTACAFRGNRAEVEAHRSVHVNWAERCDQLETKVSVLERERVRTHQALFSAALEHAPADLAGANRFLHRALRLPRTKTLLVLPEEEEGLFAVTTNGAHSYVVSVSLSNFNVSCTVEREGDAPSAPSLRVSFLHPLQPHRRRTASFAGWPADQRTWTVRNIDGITPEYMAHQHYVLVLSF